MRSAQATLARRSRTTDRPRARRRPSRGLVTVIALALVVRLAVIAATPHFIPQTDAADYDRIAVSLAHSGRFPPSLLAPGGGPTAFRPPSFPVVLAGAYAITGTGSKYDRWQAGRVLEALLGTLAVVLIGLIAARLWGPHAGLLSGAIGAVFPPLLLIGSSLMSESLFVPLVLGAVLCALVYRDSLTRRRWPWAITVGVLIGLAALTRSNGLALLLPIGLLVWSERPRRSWRSMLGPALVLAATMLTLVPWTIRNALVLRALDPIGTESGYALAGTYNAHTQHRAKYPAMWAPPVAQFRELAAVHPRADEAQISRDLDSSALHYVSAHPMYVAKVALWNSLRLLNLTGTGFERFASQYEAYPAGLAVLSVYAFWLLGALALVGALVPAARRVPGAFWGCPLVILVSSLLFIGATRYRAPADPFLVMLAALGLLEGWRRVRGRLGDGGGQEGLETTLPLPSAPHDRARSGSRGWARRSGVRLRARAGGGAGDGARARRPRRRDGVVVSRALERGGLVLRLRAPPVPHHRPRVDRTHQADPRR